MILLDAPESGQACWVNYLEHSSLLVLPLDIRSVSLTRIIEELLKEVPEQSSIGGGWLSALSSLVGGGGTISRAAGWHLARRAWSWSCAGHSGVGRLLLLVLHRVLAVAVGRTVRVACNITQGLPNNVKTISFHHQHCDGGVEKYLLQKYFGLIDGCYLKSNFVESEDVVEGRVGEVEQLRPPAWVSGRWCCQWRGRGTGSRSWSGRSGATGWGMSPRPSCWGVASGWRRVRVRLASWVQGPGEWAGRKEWSKRTLWATSEECCGSHHRLRSIAQPSHSWRENTRLFLQTQQYDNNVFAINISHLPFIWNLSMSIFSRSNSFSQYWRNWTTSSLLQVRGSEGNPPEVWVKS